ncbi:hypothetical protein ABPG75_006670 [Micractinium tetrahymenae]
MPAAATAVDLTMRASNLFTVLGLWPSNISGSHPANCPSNITFDKNDLWPELRGRMSCEWRSFQGDNGALWGSQWRTHGACALPLFTNMTAYFRYTLALSERYDINEALVKGGINPLVARSMTPQQLGGILEQQWNVTPVVTCSNGNILEVRTCFSTRLKPIDCPANTGGASSCPSVAQALPFGSTKVPEACTAYFDNIPAGTNPAAVPAAGSRAAPPPGSNGLRRAAASVLLLVAAAAAAALPVL